MRRTDGHSNETTGGQQVFIGSLQTIYRVARLEWSTMLYSPIAWLATIAFFIQTAYTYWYFAAITRNLLDLGQPLRSITTRLYPSPYGLYGVAEKFLSIYLPLLTMGLMSRELSSGTIRLVLSSPVRSRDVVLGKYLAIMGYGMVLLLILASFGVAGHLVVVNLDDGKVLAGLIGLLLLISAYAAVGLFLSSLTPYQLVAAVSTIAVLTALRGIGGLWQDVAFARDITFSLSMAWRYRIFSEGLISTRDVSYYLIITALFLGVMYIRLEGSRDTRHWSVKAIRYAIFIAVMLMAGYITSRPRLIRYWDLTATRSMSLTPESHAVAEKAGDSLQVHVFTNLVDDTYFWGMPASELGNIFLFQQFQRVIPYIDIDFTRYYDTSNNSRLYKDNPGKSTRELAMMIKEVEEYDGSLLTPRQMRARVDLSGEQYRHVWQLKAHGRHAYVRLYDDIVRSPMEAEISAAVRRLTGDQQTVTFVTGHGERNLNMGGDPASYKLAVTDKYFRFSLLNEGFTIDTVDLRQQDIPAATTILAIAAPQVRFTEAEQRTLQGWIDSGGNLFIAGEPGCAHLLNGLTGSLGILFGDTALRQASKDFEPTYIRAKLTASAVKGSDHYRRAAQAGLLLEMPGAAGLQVKGQVFRADTIAISADGRPLLVYLSRQTGNKQQRIVVSGDADFMNNAALAKSNPMVAPMPTSNYEVRRGIFNWLSYGQFPVDDYRPKDTDTRLKVTAARIHVLQLVWLWLIPGLLGLAGIIVLVHRRTR